LREIREIADTDLRERKIVATHYQHVDGTSFAAPIVASVIAQMLEANPKLTPGVIKNILIATADRSPRLTLHHQGYGLLNARRAIRYHDDVAKQVSLAGDFNDWNSKQTYFTRHASGMWRAALALLPPGTHQYKLVVDGGRWIEDPSNGLKAEDNHGGFNSVLHIAE
jgi:serine protease AprX